MSEEDIEPRVASVEGQFDQFEKRFEETVEDINDSLNRIEEGQDRTQDRVDRIYRIIVIGFLATILTVVAGGMITLAVQYLV
jgi:hypothetical protein